MDNKLPTTVNKFAQKGRLKKINGSIINPESSGLRFILSFVGLGGKYDGDNKIFADRWLKTNSEYKSWYVNRQNFKTGAFIEVPVASDIWIIELATFDKEGALDTKALASGLKKVSERAKYEHASVHMASELVEKTEGLDSLIQTLFIDNGVNVSIYAQELISK